jgi:chromosomal replication initiator protein
VAPGPITQSDVGRVWDEVRTRLRATLNAATYNLTFDRAHPAGLEDGHLTLSVETEFARGWILQRYLPLVRDAIFEVTGSDIQVDVVVEPVGPAEMPEVLAEPEAPVEPGPPRHHPRLQSRFTFESFVAGPSNRFAQAAALAVAEAPARAYNPLFIYGGVGLGKTHLLQAIGNFVAANNPGLQTTYVSVETFTTEFIQALREGVMRSFKDRYRSTDVLLIDDIQSLEGKEETQEEFFHTFNALQEGGKQIVISSDRPPKAIKTLEDRLRSRFEMGLMTDIQPPNLETRIAILSKRAESERYEIHDPEVLSFIASRVSTNVRSLEGALIRVVAHASISGRPITVDLAREVLKEYFPADQAPLTTEVIQQEVCSYYGVSMEELVGEKRTRRIVTPRQVAMYLSREMTEASLPAIGRSFGDRDHTTVLYAVEKVKRLMADQGPIYSAVRALHSRLAREQ